MTDSYVTGSVIKSLREAKKMTQESLAEKIFVSAKTVSKWETGRGFPDITLLEPLAKSLDTSVVELLSGKCVQNKNKNANMNKSKIYVCPVCGNIISSIGETVVICCGLTLPPQDPESPDTEHEIKTEFVEDEFFVSLNHPMTKEHHISFFAAFYDDGIKITKLYPEQNPETRFKRAGAKTILAYCNRHGLFSIHLSTP